MAFCKTRNDWNHGIYINDEKRFHGPVSEEKMENIIAQIIEAINNNELIAKHGIKAIKRSGGVNPLYPDILFELPDGYLTSDSANKVIEKFKKSKNINGLNSILKGEIYSMKSHKPLWLVLNNKIFIKRKKDLELTDLHKFIINVFEN